MQFHEKSIPGNRVSHKEFAEQSDPAAVPVKLLKLLPVCLQAMVSLW